MPTVSLQQQGNSVPPFRLSHYSIKRGPNRARLYHKYRDDLLRQFRPNPRCPVSSETGSGKPRSLILAVSRYSEKTSRILSEYLHTKTGQGDDRVVIGIYLEVGAKKKTLHRTMG